MIERKLPTPTWEGEAERLRRLGELNRRAWALSLRRLTPEDAARLFEELTEGFPELSFVRLPKPPPIVVSKLWRP